MKWKLNPKLKEALEWIYCILIAIILALLVRYYIGTPTIVKQPSMYPTLKQDQRLILNRLARTMHTPLKRGDIVTFEAPSQSYISAFEADLSNPIAKYENEPQGFWAKFAYYVLETTKTSYIKRVIALPGEHVKIENRKSVYKWWRVTRRLFARGCYNRLSRRTVYRYSSARRICILDGRQ